ncbi:hypothetical protein CDAR_562741 [Caerostris darwini]|uniref:Uncharacterized protein n=1 Tax=Caerostris darwini TaxID=1538125 RepID=A0AAV4X6T2_9ARAC|nr:hypothetical protein CDAR_562741 [Caerostris darwini]
MRLVLFFARSVESCETHSYVKHMRIETLTGSSDLLTERERGEVLIRSKKPRMSEPRRKKKCPRLYFAKVRQDNPALPLEEVEAHFLLEDVQVAPLD